MSIRKFAAYVYFALAVATTACTMKTDEEVDDDQEDPQPDPDPDPACQRGEECPAPDGCSRGVCDNGNCNVEPACGADEVCDEDLDRCVPEVTMPVLPAGHNIGCFLSGTTLYVTIAGKLTDAAYGGTLVSPRKVSIASDAVEGSWNTAVLTTMYARDLSPTEQSLGGAISLTIPIPTDKAQRFTLLVWPASGNAQRFDLSSWNVTGDTCARIADGTGGTATSDGDIIGRAPLCASACNDNVATTVDSCQVDGCHHGTGTTTTPGNGTISCQEVGNQTHVTISNGIKAHVFNLEASNPPTSSWLLRFGYGGTDQENWISDSTTYVLTMPSATTGFNFLLAEPNGTSHWFDVNGFDVSGTCSRGIGEFRHTASTNPPPVVNAGTIQCKLMLVNNVLKREVAIIPNANGIIAGTVQEGSPVTSPEYIQIGADSLGWPSSVGQQPWAGHLSTHYLYLDPGTDNFNLFVADNNDVVSGGDHTGGGDYFNLPAWSVTNPSTPHWSSNCHIVGGGIRVN